MLMEHSKNRSPGCLNRGWTYTNRIAPEDARQGVLDFYVSRYPHSSQEEWGQRIEEGLIHLDGKPVGADTILQTGQQLSYERPPWKEDDVPRDIQILHEDDDILALAKPAGLPVLPGGNFLENTLLAMMSRRYGGDPPPAPIHRLGRGTSGVMLLGRSQRARRRLCADIRDRGIRKTYRALARGTRMPPEFVIEAPIGRVPYPILGTLYGVTPRGKYARTECMLLYRDHEHGNAILEVVIPTGRSHQIRIHLAYAGLPLVGDPIYGTGGKPVIPVDPNPVPLPGDGGYYLHAHEVRFFHPGTGKEMTVSCPPPDILCPPD